MINNSFDNRRQRGKRTFNAYIDRIADSFFSFIYSWLVINIRFVHLRHQRIVYRYSICSVKSGNLNPESIHIFSSLLNTQLIYSENGYQLLFIYQWWDNWRWCILFQLRIFFYVLSSVLLLNINSNAKRVRTSEVLKTIVAEFKQRIELLIEWTQYIIC